MAPFLVVKILFRHYLLPQHLHDGNGHGHYDDGGDYADDEAVGHAAEYEHRTIVIEEYAVQPVDQGVAYGGEGSSCGADSVKGQAVQLRKSSLFFYEQGKETDGEAPQSRRYEIKYRGVGDAISQKLL